MERPRPLPHGDRALGKHTRWSPLKAPERQTVGQLATLWEVQQANRRLHRAFLLREELRLYQLDDPELAPAHLDAWLAWASRSRLRPFVRLARTLKTHRDGILAAVRLGLSNGRFEGLNSKIRLMATSRASAGRRRLAQERRRRPRRRSNPARSSGAQSSVAHWLPGRARGRQDRRLRRGAKGGQYKGIRQRSVPGPTPATTSVAAGSGHPCRSGNKKTAL
jgi:Transposase